MSLPLSVTTFVSSDNFNQSQWRMAMKKQSFLTKRHSILLAAALLALSAGTASARITHDASSTNVQAATGGVGYAAPHEVPENGGAADMIQPGNLPN
jgi:hypothetical protein